MEKGTNINIEYTDGRFEARVDGTSADIVGNLVRVLMREKKMITLFKQSLIGAGMNPKQSDLKHARGDFDFKLSDKGEMLSFAMCGCDSDFVLVFSVLFNMRKDLAIFFGMAVVYFIAQNNDPKLETERVQFEKIIADFKAGKN